MKIKRFLLGLAVAVFGLLSFSAKCYAAPAEYTDLMADAVYREDENGYVHEYGDGILVEDYTLPEDTNFHWYNGHLTIAEGVTLTIPEGSSLEISIQKDASENPFFLLEEGATIRILGEKQFDEYGAYVPRLNFIYTKAYINGTIESKAQGMDAWGADFRLNGNIYSDGPALHIEQSEVAFTGGEYLTGDSPVILKKYEQEYENIVTISGGVFSQNMEKGMLAPNVEMKKKDDGTFEAIALPESGQEPTEEGDKTDAASGAMGSTSAKAKGAWETLKDLCKKGIEKAKEVYAEAVAENGGVANAWKNKEFLVCMILVFGIACAVLYCIYDFIRAPFKKKLKLLWEAVLVLVIVGGGYYLIWQYVIGDMADEQTLTRPTYSEEQTIEKVFVKDNRSALSGMEAYGPGIYAVGKDIAPGVYFFEAEDVSQRICPFYIYFSKTPDFAEKEIGLWDTRSFVELEEGWYVTVRGANFVPAGEQKAYEPSQVDSGFVYGTGEYQVGRDITPGTYTYEPANEETFVLQVRDSAISADEVAWSNYTMYSGETYDMSREENSFTLREGQSLTVGAWSNVVLKTVE
ncbi:MAG: hypothetical protein IKY23_04415 [Lachnospiraceae bacterium]|nr:hypothetical protein [Lachnospiraceae bacterium]